jgi:non-ribosomal peptide synthetase-like protein
MPQLLRDELLHELFESAADEHPDRIAVECGDERLTYLELDRRANQLAHHLRSIGARPASRVALLLSPSVEAYVAILGVLKAGAAYVPLDADCPPDRIGYILRDCGVHSLITTSALAGAIDVGETRLVALDREADEICLHPATRVPAGVTNADLCYIIYTSGSSGRPKGVEITHRSAAHLVRAEGEIFQVTPRDRVYQGFSIAFDASVEEIWLALFAGATLVAASAGMRRSGPDLVEFLATNRISVLSCVPTLLSMMNDDGEVPTLRLLILGGEACPSDLVRRWTRPGRRIVNTYGPTEATVIATYGDLQPDRPVNIGRAVPNYDVRLLDPQTRLPTPAGEIGEIHIGGVGLARGYVGRPDLTAERLIADPCNAALRLYRTGDLGRLTADGQIEFAGRIDTQVKLRGFRIELAEIESALMQCRGVRSAVVALRRDSAGIEQLSAYVVPSRAIDEVEIRSDLRARLPAYMVPATIDTLPTLPTLPSGKVDRAALPAPTRRGGPMEADRSLNPVERKLAEAWQMLFGSVAVAQTDDFFLDLGGHSLLAATMVSNLRLEADFHDLSVLDIYNYPTIAALAAEIAKRRARETAAPTAAISPARPSALRHALCSLAQLPGLYLVIGLYSLQWLAPYLVYSCMISEGHALLASLVCAIGALVVLPPAMLVIAIVAKWLIIGRYRPGRYPVWGWYYLRWWLVERLASLAPTGFLAGTPLLAGYLRLLGARVGRNVHLGTDDIGAPDLICIGDDASIGDDATINNVTVEDGWLKIGRADIGSHCYVGVRSVVGLDTTIENGGRLEDLSLLPAGGRIPAAETWLGSPAKPLPRDRRQQRPQPPIEPTTHGRVWRAGLLHALGVLVLPTTYLLALLPGMLAIVELGSRFGWQRSLLAAPLVALSFVVLLCLEIAAFKWLLLGRVKAGRYSLHGGFYLRKWFVDQLMGLSLDVLGPLYSTLYVAPWYRLLGARLGRGAELSTACSASPDMLDIGEASFIADHVSLGAARVENGAIAIAPTRIGRRAFIGNSAMIPAGANVGDDALVGVLSAPPRSRGGDTVAPGTSWLGSPAIYLPQRDVNQSFPEEATFKPSRKLHAQRYAIEFFRITLPITAFVILTAILLHAVIWLRSSPRMSIPAIAGIFPLLYTACGAVAVALVVAAKWLLIGRYAPRQRPLWSTFVWRTELLTALHENLADAFLVDMLCGTPWVCWFFRLLGARIGRRVFLDTTCLTEFDLICIGDDAVVNAAATLQTHLFEDRVMKMSAIDVGARCSVGTASVVLYDTRMSDGSSLGDLSLLMKGESLPPATRWQGSPARLGAEAAVLCAAPIAPAAVQMAFAAANAVEDDARLLQPA